MPKLPRRRLDQGSWHPTTLRMRCVLAACAFVLLLSGCGPGHLEEARAEDLASINAAIDSCVVLLGMDPAKQSRPDKRQLDYRKAFLAKVAMRDQVAIDAIRDGSLPEQTLRLQSLQLVKELGERRPQATPHPVHDLLMKQPTLTIDQRILLRCLCFEMLDYYILTPPEGWGPSARKRDR